MHGQDRWVMHMHKSKRKGFFVELGAYDGIRGSDTALLERQYGWNGICIEADTLLFAKLSKRRHCMCVHACVDGAEREALFLRNADLYGGITEYFPPGHDLVVQQYLSHTPQAEQVQTRTLASILRDCRAPSVIDYMSLDTEGSEAAILETFPFDVYRILTMTVEHNARPEYRERIRTLLLGIGYRLDTETSRDDFFVHRSLV